MHAPDGNYTAIIVERDFYVSPTVVKEHEDSRVLLRTGDIYWGSLLRASDRSHFVVDADRHPTLANIDFGANQRYVVMEPRPPEPGAMLRSSTVGIRRLPVSDKVNWIFHDDPTPVWRELSPLELLAIEA